MGSTKPFVFRNIVFELPGAISPVCTIDLKVSRGMLFLGDTDSAWALNVRAIGRGLTFMNGTQQGGSQLRFFATAEDIRDKILTDIRYAWDDADCSQLAARRPQRCSSDAVSWAERHLRKRPGACLSSGAVQHHRGQRTTSTAHLDRGAGDLGVRGL